MISQLVHLAGPQGQDKDDFLAELVAALRERGLSVGLLQAGGQGVSLSLPLGGAAPGSAEALASLRNLDLVISLLPPAEGQATVEFAPSGPQAVEPDRPGLLFAAGPGQAGEAAARLADRATAKADKRSITVLADGQPLPAKRFVRDILANSLHGLIGPLKGAEDAARLEIIIE